jgi:tetratricopeptide (TPR) repeat protein
LVAAGGRPVRAVAPASSYRQGAFAEAEQGWRAAAARDPRDWTARYNLSLALAQQNRWDEAAAQAAAAFVQHPDDASVRWQFALTCDKAGFAPGALIAFLAPGPLQDLGRLASPADWQRVAALAAILAAGGLVWLLAVGYGCGGRRSLRAGAGLVGAALLLGATAAAGWHAYGSTHDSRAVIVWHGSTLRSIPTEADAAQKTTPLGAGSVAVVDKTFLGWARLAFGNGQTGWVRQGDLVGIWR